MAVVSDLSIDSPSVEGIVSKGQYFLVDENLSRPELLSTITETFLGVIRELEGSRAAASVAEHGLGQMHRFVPTEKVLLMQEAVRVRLRHLLYSWSYETGRDRLGLVDPFYIDELIVIRVHYPFSVAQSAKRVEQPKRTLAEVADQLTSAVRNPRLLGHQVRKALGSSEQGKEYAPQIFHRGLSKPAQSHGAHIDTWYGHSYDGINLWFSIAGVNPQNTVILYPDMSGRPIRFSSSSMYRDLGEPLSEPHHIDLSPGWLLLFNPETLHSTRVNTSSETRVALTTRINPQRPRFSSDAPFSFEKWHRSNEISQRRYRSLKVYPSASNPGRSSLADRPSFGYRNTVWIGVNQVINDGARVKLLPSEEVSEGIKYAIDLRDAKLILWRDSNGEVSVYQRTCPHIGVDLVDGWHDEQGISCPGHGVKFSWSEGITPCGSFALKKYLSIEKDGWIEIAAAQDGEVI